MLNIRVGESDTRYPPHVRRLAHPEMEHVPPGEFDFEALERWSYPLRRDGRKTSWLEVYTYIENQGLLVHSPGLCHLRGILRVWSISRKAQNLLRNRLCTIIGWRSVAITDTLDWIVPYLKVEGRECQLKWASLSASIIEPGDFGVNFPKTSVSLYVVKN